MTDTMQPIPNPKDITKKILLALPDREWQEEKIYDWLYLVPTGQRHDSGYGLIAIIGVLHIEAHKREVAEIAALCDDVCWGTPQGPSLRTDCSRSGVLRMWSAGGRFRVGSSLSSTTVEIVTG